MLVVVLFGISVQSFHLGFLCFISCVVAGKELVTKDLKILNLIGEQGEEEQMENG